MGNARKKLVCSFFEVHLYALLLTRGDLSIIVHTTPLVKQEKQK